MSFSPDVWTEPRTSGGSRAWRKGLFLCGATALAILALGYFVSRQVPARYTASAVVFERSPAAATPSSGVQAGQQSPAEAVRKEILAEASLRRAIAEMNLGSGEPAADLAAKLRDEISVEVNDANHGGRRVAIASTTDSAEQAATLVNLLARYYVDDHNRSAQAAARRAGDADRAASERVDTARREWTKAETELDAFLDQHFAGLTAAPPAKPDRPAAPEVQPPEKVAPAPDPSSAVTELQSQIDALVGRRAELLVRMTPEHPDVQDLDTKIAELKQQLAAMTPATRPSAPKSPAEAAPAPQLVAPARPEAAPGGPAARQAHPAREYQAHKETRDRAVDAYFQLAKSERGAWENRVARSNPDLRVVEFARIPARPDTSTRTLVTALAVVLAVMAAAGMAFAAGRGEATLTSAADAEAALCVPIVGVISGTSTHPLAKRKRQ